MRLAWCSDIHLDHLNETETLNFADRLQSSDSDAIIITGDIANGKILDSALNKLESRITKPVWFILGNHDYFYSSFKDVNNLIKTRTKSKSNFKCVQFCGITPLSPSVCIVGHSGWYDGRNGDFFGYYSSSDWMSTSSSSFDLNDFEYIKDIKPIVSREKKQLLFNKLGSEAAHYMSNIVKKAAKKYKTIIMLTHCPPFAEVSKHEGGPCSKWALPFYSSKVMSETLLDLKEEFPATNLIMFCGHTHSPAELHIDNLHVYVAGAIYGDPDIYTIVTIKDNDEIST